MSESRDIIVGVVADTHGLLRPELLEIFNDVDLIIHAGDLGKERVLGGLKGGKRSLKFSYPDYLNASKMILAMPDISSSQVAEHFGASCITP